MEPQTNDEDSFQKWLSTGPSAYAFDTRTETWSSCILQEKFDAFTQLYTVNWESDGKESHVPSIFVFRLRQNESVSGYVRRLVKALSTRRDACRRLRYDLYVDSMPTEDCPKISEEQLKRIVQKARDLKQLRDSSKTYESALIVENIAQSAYAREMNRIVFEMHLSANSSKHDLLKSISSFGISDAIKQAKNRAERLMSRDFVATKGCHEMRLASRSRDQEDDDVRTFATLLRTVQETAIINNENVVKILEDVRHSCDKMRRIYCFDHFQKETSRNMQLLRFQTVESNHIKRSRAYLEDKWALEIKSTIEKTFTGDESGDYDISETKRKKYESTKLKTFFDLVNVMMEDSIRFMIMGSVQTYRDSLIGNLEKNLEEVKEIRKEEQSSDDKVNTTTPLFSVDLVVKSENTPDGVIAFSNDPEAFSDMSVKMMRKGLESLRDVVRVERRVMNRLFWKSSPVIDSVSSQERWIQDIEKEILTKFEEIVKPVKAYLNTFKKHLEFVRRDPKQYAKEIMKEFQNPGEEEDDEDHGDEDMSEEVLMKLLESIDRKTRFHKKKIEEIEREIPDEVHINIFSVKCVPIREYLVEKHKQMRMILVDLLITSNNKACEKLLSVFRDIQGKIEAPVSNIEELAGNEEYIKESKTLIEETWQKALRVLSKFELLDTMRVQLRKSEFENRWNLFGTPNQIHKAIKSRVSENGIKREAYQKSMQEEQIMFEKEIASLDADVQDMQQMVVLEDHGKNADIVRSTRAKITKMKEQSQRFNSREALFDVESTEYTRLNAIQKTFEPYVLVFSLFLRVYLFILSFTHSLTHSLIYPPICPLTHSSTHSHTHTHT